MRIKGSNVLLIIRLEGFYCGVTVNEKRTLLCSLIAKPYIKKACFCLIRAFQNNARQEQLHVPASASVCRTKTVRLIFKSSLGLCFVL